MVLKRLSETSKETISVVNLKLISPKYGTPGLSYHDKSKFVRCLYHYVVCFNSSVVYLYH